MIQHSVEAAGSVTAAEFQFVERRRKDESSWDVPAERRQFRDGDRSARPEVAELANAIDDYKISRRRRFITFEELFDVMTSLGYQKRDPQSIES